MCERERESKREREREREREKQEIFSAVSVKNGNINETFSG